MLQNCHRQACKMHNFSEEDAYSFKKNRMLCQKVHPGWSLVVVKVGYIEGCRGGLKCNSAGVTQWQGLSTSLATQLYCVIAQEDWRAIKEHCEQLT